MTLHDRGKPFRAGADLVVVDLGVGIAAALVARHFQQLGARVLRCEPAPRDPFYDLVPAYPAWRAGSTPVDRQQLPECLLTADVCILGGESIPGGEAPFDIAPAEAANPRLVTLSLTGYVDPELRHRPVLDSLVQARSGLCFTEHVGRPRCFAFPAPSYGAALLAMIEVWAALVQRERTGKGRRVIASLQQGAAIWCGFDWVTVERPDDASQAKIPRGVRQLVFRCADGGYLQFVMSSPGALGKVYKALEIDLPVDPADRGMPRPLETPDKFFGDTDLFARHVARFPRAELLGRLWEAGIAAEAVMYPGEVWSDEQVLINEIVTQNLQGVREIANPLRLHVHGDVIQKSDARRLASAPSTAPLTGVCIVDLGAFVAGPLASRFLADLGADVIKVEPLTGDPMHYHYGAWSASNDGKRGLCVNLKSEQGAAILRRLFAQADVVHYNFRPGAAERLGADPAALRKIRADIATLDTLAYGSSGPKALNSGFDMVLQALCGHAVRGAGEHGLPQPYRAAIVDQGAGALGAIGILIALYTRLHSGLAMDVQCSLLDTGLFLMSELIQFADGTWAGAPLMNAEQTGIHPRERLYETRTGWIAIAVRSNAMADAVGRVLKLPLGPVESWNETGGAQIAARLRTLDRDSVLRELSDAGVWCEACVEDGWTALQNDAVARGKGFVRVRPDEHYGQITSIAPLFELGNASAQKRSAPHRGQHTREILTDLGFSAGEIESLYGQRIVA